MTRQFIEFEQTRSETFKLLATCFYPPDREDFSAENTLHLLPGLLGRVCQEATPHAAIMYDVLPKYNDEELLVEYARLFVGPFGLKAPPYGSVYLDDARKLMGDSTIAVIKMYQDQGLSLDENFKELPDHIAAELEFMYFLAYHEVEALEKNDTEKAAHFLNRQETFLRTFLRPWVVPFSEKIRQGTENRFYHALADCLAVFITKTNHRDAMPEELITNLARN